jgi:putative phosphoribosyl transferase
MIFDDRTDAGKKLAEKLRDRGGDLIVLALPRGGVPVGFEIAKRLDTPLDVLVVRKLGAPHNPEFGIGAIAAGNVKILDQAAIEYLGITPEEIKDIEQKEQIELDRRIKEYRGLSSPADIKDKTVILVDDGLATGITIRAAIKAVLQQRPARLIVTLPVCPLDGVQGVRSILRPMKDDFICLSTPYDFSAVGYWYKSFDAVSDLEVVDLLEKSKRQTRPVMRTRYNEPETGLHPIRIK